MLSFKPALCLLVQGRWGGMQAPKACGAQGRKSSEGHGSQPPEGSGDNPAPGRPHLSGLGLWPPITTRLPDSLQGALRGTSSPPPLRSTPVLSPQHVPSGIP